MSEPAVLSGDARDFAACTFRSLATHLSPVAEGWIAIGLRDAEGAPCALALGEVLPCADGRAREALLASLMVVPQARGRRLGRTLLAAFEAEAARRGATRLRSRHVSSLPARAAFEATLRGGGWPDGHSCRTRITWRAGYAAAGMARWPALSERVFRSGLYRMEGWAPLSAADTAAVARLKAQETHRAFDFFLDDVAPKADPRISLLLRRGDELVGWVIGMAHPQPVMGRPAVYWASAYLDETIWHSSFMIAAYAEATARQAQVYGPDSIGFFDTDLPRNQALVRRRLAPLAFKCEEVVETIKPLGPS